MDLLLIIRLLNYKNVMSRRIIMVTRGVMHDIGNPRQEEVL